MLKIRVMFVSYGYRMGVVLALHDRRTGVACNARTIIHKLIK
jgi:hypothetical protein